MSVNREVGCHDHSTRWQYQDPENKIQFFITGNLFMTHTLERFAMIVQLFKKVSSHHQLLRIEWSTERLQAWSERQVLGGDRWRVPNIRRVGKTGSSYDRNPYCLWTDHDCLFHTLLLLLAHSATPSSTSVRPICTSSGRLPRKHSPPL